MPATLPKNLQTYFWDVDAKKLNISHYSFYVSERLLELGDCSSLIWLQNNYGLDYLKKVVTNSKALSKKSARFYSLFFHINPKEILCLQEEFQHKHRAIWPN